MELLCNAWFGEDKNIEFRVCEGKGSMGLALQKKRGGGILDQENKTLKIIFDVDNGFEESQANIYKQLEELPKELKIDPHKTEIFPLLNNKDKGNLGALLEKVATIQEAIDCFKKYRHA